jgi:tetratricopeptide (TPR) repeat protein
MHETVGLALDKEKEKHAAAEIAHHFNKAVNEKSGKETLEKAVEYNILAGDAAAKLFATDIALQHYRNALPLLQRLEAKEKEMDVLVKALNFSQKTDYNLTRDLAATLLEAAIKTGDEQKQAEAYGFLAYVESKQGNKRGAIDILQKELEIAERNKFSLNAIRANRRVGVNYKELGEYEKAIEYINKAFAEIGKKQITSEEKEFENKLIYEEAALNNILGLIKVEQGEHDDAYEFYKKSLKLYEKINNIFEIPLSYNNIGTIHHKKGNYNAALEEYLKGFEIVQKNKDVPYLSLIATNISDIYQRTMELDKAEEYAAIALESAEKVGAPHLIARSFFIYGDIYRQRGDWKNASKKYHESLDRIRAGNRPVVFASYLEEAAGYFKEFNEPKQAQKLYNEALEIFQKVGNEKKMREITEKLKEF